jgi:peroxiredoxin
MFHINTARRAWAAASILATLAAAAGGLAGQTDRQAAEDVPTVLEIGGPAPDFTLTDTEGHKHTLSALTGQGQIVVLEWFNPDCPFIKKHHVLHSTMIDLEKKLRDRKVTWLAINSGAPGKQGNGLEHNRQAKKDYHIDYPLLLDEDGRVGRMYGAKTTPHMFVIAADGTLIYEGAIDDNRSPLELGKINYVEQALQQHLAGKKVETPVTASYGCSVKYADPGS